MKKGSPLENKQILEETLKMAKENSAPSVEEYFSNSGTALDSEVDLSGEDIGIVKDELNFKEITDHLHQTDHLPGYQIFEEDLGLKGDSYKPLKKAMYYYHNAIRQPTTTIRINKTVLVDNRIHLLEFTPPGSGKSTMKNQIKRVMKDLSGENGVIEVSGISHPEQLVGKIVYVGKGDKKKADKRLGLLGYKAFINDETQDLINEIKETYAQAQRLKRIAMDCYGLNEISKKLIEDSPKNTLKYFSRTCVCDFAHPQKLKSAFFDTGSFRRYFAFNLEQEETINLSDIGELSFETKKKNIYEWKRFLDNLYIEEYDELTKFDDTTLKIISVYHKTLLNFLINHHNKNVSRYAYLVKHSLRDMFCSNTLILAKARKEIIPSPDTAVNACKDTILFVLESIKTYNSLGNIGSSSDVWGGVSDEDGQALEYLLNKKALSKESSNISIKKFVSIVCNFYGCNYRQGRAHYYRLKKDGFINSAQKGQYDSVVWLTFYPKEIKISENYDPIPELMSIFQGDNQKTRVFATLKQSFIDGDTSKKPQGYKGYGVLGCVLINKNIDNTIRVEAYIDKNNNNIYNNSQRLGGNSEPLPPSTFDDTLSSIKTPIEGCKNPEKPSSPSNRGLHIKSSDNPKSNPKKVSDRDLQYWEDPITKDITDKGKEIQNYIKKNPKVDFKTLLEKFGPSVVKAKKEGLIK